MTYSLQINMIIKCGVTAIALTGGGRIKGESVFVNAPTLLNFSDGDWFFNTRRSLGDFGRVTLAEKAGKNGAESMKYWHNSSKSLCRV